MCCLDRDVFSGKKSNCSAVIRTDDLSDVGIRLSRTSHRPVFCHPKHQVLLLSLRCSSDQDGQANGNQKPTFRPGNLSKNIAKNCKKFTLKYPRVRAVQCYQKSRWVSTPDDSVRSSGRGQDWSGAAAAGTVLDRWGEVGDDAFQPAWFDQIGHQTSPRSKRNL